MRTKPFLADIFAHTIDMLLDRGHSHSNRVRRERVSLTDFLNSAQKSALISFAGCVVNELSKPCPETCSSQRYRNIDGSCNNLRNSSWGASNMPQRRLLDPIYQDGIGQPVQNSNGFELPMVRRVSNRLGGESNLFAGRDEEYNHILTVWGQYIDHDMDLTPQSKAITSFQGNTRCETTCANANPCFPIQLPLTDPKRADGRACLPFFRSAAICGTGTTSALVNGDPNVFVRQQINAVTSFIDASTVYGSTLETLNSLRNFERPDLGLMKTNDQFDDNGRSYLPFSGDACVQGIKPLMMHSV